MGLVNKSCKYILISGERRTVRSAFEVQTFKFPVLSQDFGVPVRTKQSSIQYLASETNVAVCKQHSSGQCCFAVSEIARPGCGSTALVRGVGATSSYVCVADSSDGSGDTKRIPVKVYARNGKKRAEQVSRSMKRLCI